MINVFSLAELTQGQGTETNTIKPHAKQILDHYRKNSNGMRDSHGRGEQMRLIEAEPVVHAHWEYRDSAFAYEGEFGGYVCSNCNRAFIDDLCQDNGAEMVNVGEEFKYCPYCGARMDEVSR